MSELIREHHQFRNNNKYSYEIDTNTHIHREIDKNIMFMCM